MTPFDCELIGEGLAAQPINTVSSLAFLVVAIVAYRRHRRVAAAALGMVAVGSALFHGWPSTPSTIVHGLSNAFLIGLLVRALWLLRRKPPWAAIGLLAGARVIWASSRTGGPWCDPSSLLQGHAAWHILAAIGCWMVLDRRVGLNGRSAPQARPPARSEARPGG